MQSSNKIESFIVDDNIKKKRTEQKKKQEHAYYEKHKQTKLDQVKAWRNTFIFENGTEVPVTSQIFDNGAGRSKKYWILDETGGKIPVFKRGSYTVKKSREKKPTTDYAIVNADKIQESREKKNIYNNAFLYEDGIPIPDNVAVFDNMQKGKNKIFYIVAENNQQIRVYRRNHYYKNLALAKKITNQAQDLYQGINNNNHSIAPIQNEELVILPTQQQEITIEFKNNEKEEFHDINDMNFFPNGENNKFYLNDLLSDQFLFGDYVNRTAFTGDDYELIQSPSKKSRTT